MLRYLFIMFLLLLVSCGKRPETYELVIQPTNRLEYEQFAREIGSRYGLRSKGFIEKLNIWLVEVETTDKQKIIDKMSTDSTIKMVEESRTCQLYRLPNDPLLGFQYYIELMEIDKAWVLLKDNTNEVKVAVIDSGLDSHIDIKDNIILGYNAVTASTLNTEEGSGHGSSCSGLISAIINNNLGMAGILPNSKVAIMKVEDGRGIISQFAVARALVETADRGIRVANLSLGSLYGSEAMRLGCEYAASKGVILVAAAGNENTYHKSYPAAFPNVMSISATDKNDQRASFSNYGDWIDFSAPGSSVLTIARDDKYILASGTSFSSPIASAVIGLLLKVNPALSYSEIYSILAKTSDDLGIIGKDIYFGHGRINAKNAVLEVLNGK